MESLIPVLVGDELELLPDLVRPGTPRAAGRSGADPDPGRRPGPHRQRVPGGVLDGGGDRRRAPIDLGSSAYRTLEDVLRGRPGRRTADLADRAVRHRQPTLARRRRRPTAAKQPPVGHGAGLPRRARRALDDARARQPAAAPPCSSSPVPAPRPGGRAAGRGRHGRRRRRARPDRAAAHRRGHRHLRAAGERLRPRDSGLAILTEADLTGTRGVNPETAARLPTRRRNAVDPVSLKPGDYVVHAQHGIGKYVDMVQRTVGGATREYLVVEYAPSKRGQPGDRLFVPTDALDLLSRYVGGEVPTLNKLGGADWAKTKGRARKAVRQIAAQARPAVRGPGVSARATRSRRTPRGSASWRTPSRTPRRRTRWPRSTRSRPTWKGRSRWTG